MSESNKMLELRIKRSVESNVPDVWQNILLRIEEEKTNPSQNFQQQELAIVEKQKPKIHWVKWATSMAAVLVVLLGTLFYINLSPDSTVNLEINPSLELSVSPWNKVLSVTPLNEEAVTIIDGMNLKNTKLDVAINALVGSMVKNGFLSEYSNSILVTVDNPNHQKGVELQNKLSEEINSVLKGYSFDGAILSLAISEDEQLIALAKENNISLGKAALVDLLVKQDPTLDFASVSTLSINDINLLIASKTTTDTDQELATIGNASSVAYIGLEAAKNIVFHHASVDDSRVNSFEIDFGYEDGHMIYEVEFDTNNGEYEYHINAVTGDILTFEHEQHKATNGNNSHSSTATTDLSISLAKAIEIATDDAGIYEYDIEIVKQASYQKQGTLFFDIEFTYNSLKYSYLINATTGKIEERYIKEIFSNSNNGNNSNSNNGNNNSNSNSNSNNSNNNSSNSNGNNKHAVAQHTNYISSTTAISVALSKVGVSQSQITDLECELDEDDDVVVYEIEFSSNGTDYEFIINAINGAIVKWDKEKNRK